MRPAESMCINQRHRRSCARVASMRNWCDGRVRGCDWQDLFFKMMAIDHRFIGLILRAKPVQVSGGYSQLLISFLLLEWMDPIRILLMVEKCCDTLFALKINGCNLKITQLIQGRSSEANTSIIVFQPFIFKGVLFTSGFVHPKWSFEKPWKLVTHHKDRDGTKGKAKVRPVFFFFFWQFLRMLPLNLERSFPMSYALQLYPWRFRWSIFLLGNTTFPSFSMEVSILNFHNVSTDGVWSLSFFGLELILVYSLRHPCVSFLIYTAVQYQQVLP